jgi:O-antigen/teichoic acid export membrane protein
MLKKTLNSPILMVWSAQFTRFGSMVFVTPLILANYESIEQSFWYLIGTVIGFALLADSGFGSALVRAVSYYRAGETTLPKNRIEYDNRLRIENLGPNYQKLRDLLATTRSIYYILGIMSILLLLIGTLIFRNIFTLSGNRIDFWIAYFLLMPLCYQMILQVRWSSFMSGLNFVAQEARVSALIEVVKITIFILLLSFKLSPMYLVITMIFASTAKYIYVRSFITKWFRERNFEISRYRVFDRDIFRSLWAQTWRLAGIFWGNYMVEYGNSFLIAQLQDTRLMACYLFTTNILSWIKNFSRTPLFANIPTIYKLGAEKNFAELKLKAAQFIFLGALIMLSSCAFIGIVGNPLIGFLDTHKIMTTDTRFIGTLLFIIMVFTQFFDMHSDFHAGIYTSTNHIPFLLPSLISGVLIVVIGYFVLPIYSLTGLIIVRFLIQASFNYWYATSLSLKLLKWPFKQYLVDLPLQGSKYLTNKFRNGFFSANQ